MACATAVGVALATWGCRYRELKPISFGGHGGSSGTGVNSGAVIDGGARRLSGDGDEEEGFTRGRGRDAAAWMSQGNTAGRLQGCMEKQGY